MVDLRSQNPKETLDVVGRICPYPLVMTKKILEKMASGEILKILCDIPEFAEESIPRFVEKHRYKLETIKFEDEGHWELYIKKT